MVNSTNENKSQRYYFKVDHEIYERYVYGKYRSFMIQLDQFLSKLSENPNCEYFYGRGSVDRLVYNKEESSGISSLNDYLINIRNKMTNGYEEVYAPCIADNDKYKCFVPAIVDNAVFTINVVNKDGNRCTNKKRANKIIKNFYNAGNVNGLEDFIATALFKNGISHNFCVTTYHTNDSNYYTYHLADNLSMTLGIVIPDVSITNSDAEYKDYFTTMLIHCTLDITGYNVNLMGMME